MVNTMDLDDLQGFRQLDKQNMLAELEGLPDQLQCAWELGLTMPLPNRAAQDYACVAISGMGGSAIGADLLAAYVSPTCGMPIIVHRDYGLPAHARGKSTLFVASSHSGETEETLDGYEAALRNDCTMIAITTGGELARRAREHNVPLWQFKHKGQPRAAVGYSFGLLLARGDMETG